MQEKKKRRAHATNYLIENKNKYILRYPEEDLERLKCFKHFGLGSLPVNSSSAWTFSRISVWSLSRNRLMVF
ncbi:hypothetical protein GLOIN_2v1776825 [Rhizophagus irregularis DAOM 181602=DAOM 197198]|nr:hypothetical protein GLOIN_2v1776825 [Rhizophagus irregularis DAOM 181602=DAOM 197198]